MNFNLSKNDHRRSNISEPPMIIKCIVPRDVKWIGLNQFILSESNYIHEFIRSNLYIN